MKQSMEHSVKVIQEVTKPSVRYLVEDLVQHATPDELRAQWETDLDSSNFAARDSLLEAMVRRDIRPQNWIETRDIESGLYPDVTDPDFASRLYKKSEFAALASTAVDVEACTRSQTTFEKTAVQQLVARFLHPSTPYRGLLLDHGVGVGKTCSAITVAETFLDIMPGNVVYILAPQAIADGFKKTIFDVNRLVEASKETTALTGDVWASPQCTGMTYLRLTGTAGNRSREEIVKEVDKRIRKRYRIMGYLAFANWMEGKFKAIPEVVQGEAREDRKKEIIMSLFSDHLLIIDEAHNLRDADADSGLGAVDEVDGAKHSDSADGKRLTPILQLIVSIAEGLRLMLMTATPMYNSAPEIVHLLNLLTLNDTKDSKEQMVAKEIFQGDGSFTATGEARITKYIKRYVSFMRGENPSTFPLRLLPKTLGGRKFVDAYPTVSITRREGTVSMTETQKKIMERLPLIVHNASLDSVVGGNLHKVLEGYANPTGIEVNDFILDKTIQMSNVTYPDGSFGTTGWSTYMKGEETTIRGQKILQYSWNSVPNATGVAPTLEDVYGHQGLVSHAPKISAIVSLLESSVGMSFVYSRYLPAGALPLAVALELAGWCRVLADGTPAPILKGIAKQKYKHYYILLTGNNMVSPNFKGLLDYATTFKDTKEAEGAKVKAIIGSQVASEGLDLKCIRQIHLLDGWYHLNRIEQIIGRGVRFCSHSALTLEKRNCLIYLHVVSVPKYETGDLYAYRLAIRKAEPIGQVTRLMKRHAWDCMLNKSAILLSYLDKRPIVDGQGDRYDEPLQDKEYSSFCDFMEECEYICASKPVLPTEVGKDISTRTKADFRRVFSEKQRRLIALFEKEDVAIPLEFIKKEIYKDIPPSFADMGLREVLDKVKLRRHDGLIGTLIYRNKYIVFQPDQVTDPEIPIAMRYGRAFGRLPRTIEPLRGSIMTASAEPVVKVEATEATQSVQETNIGDPKESARISLRIWSVLVDKMIRKPNGLIPDPATDSDEFITFFDKYGFSKEAFNGWRWLFHYFGSLEQTELIAARWWMDSLWKPRERSAILQDWVVRGPGTLTGQEAVYVNTFKPVELFEGEVRGCMTFEKDLQILCFADGDTVASRCSDLYKPYVEKVVPKPVDRGSVDQMGMVYGFLVMKKGNVVFKTVDLATGKLGGAECANTTNLGNHRVLIQKIHAQIKSLYMPEDPLVKLLLKDEDPKSPEDLKKMEDDAKLRKDALKHRYDPKFKAEKPDMKIEHIYDLSRLQICPYMEFLLRLLDMKHAGGKRWFLSLVDTARSGVKMT